MTRTKLPTNAQLLSCSDCDSINFADRCDSLDRDLLAYVYSSRVASDWLIALTYRRLAVSLAASIARYMLARDLPRFPEYDTVSENFLAETT